MGKPKQLPFQLNSGLDRQASVRDLVSSTKVRMNSLTLHVSEAVDLKSLTLRVIVDY